MKHYPILPDINNPNVQLLGKEESPKKEYRKKIFKEIKAHPNFSVKGELVLYTKNGTSIQGFARQKGILCLDDGFKQVRFVLLDVYLHGALYHYAIPVEQWTKYPSLPEISVSEEESEVLYKIAKALLTTKSRQEKICLVKRTEQVDLKENRNKTQDLTSCEELVANLLKEPWILSTVTECLLCNIRPWLPKELVPMHITAFVAQSKSGQACQDTLLQLLTACNLTATQVPMLNLHSKEDLNVWERYGCRLSLTNPDVKTREKMFQKTQKLHLLEHYSSNEPPYTSQILLWARKKFSEPHAHHITLPQEPSPLTSEEQDAFRSFMAKILAKPKKLTQRVVDEVQDILENADGYRITPMEAWQKTVETIIAENLLIHCQTVKMAQAQRKAEEERGEQLLDDSIELVTNPNRYLEGISTIWAENGVGVRESLEEYFALYKHNKNNARYLCFTENSMARLCNQLVGLPRENIELLLGRLLSLGILNEKNTNEKLKKKNEIRLIRLYTEYCESFSLAEITVNEEDTDDV